MATLVLRPNAAGSITQLAKSGSGGNNYDRVDEETANDADYVWNSDDITSSKYDLYNIPNHGAESGDISKIAIYGRCKKTGMNAGSCAFCLRTGSTTTYYSTTWRPSSYAEYNKEWSTNPRTGVAWTWTDIDGLQIGFQGNNAYDSEMPGNAYLYCSQLWVVITYTPAANVPASMYHRRQQGMG